MKGVPDQIGPYRIETEIGRGGMGVVYRARDTNLDRLVAVKAMSAHLTSDPIKLARFEREAKLLASLNHPRIAAIYALQEHEGARYLVLELLEGRMLRDVLREGRLPLERAVDVCRQIADALEAAHRQGVVHRDLKPANVCVTDEGQVKVLDFGLAKSLAAGPAGGQRTVTGQTIEGTIVGTPGYMSPEQTRGQPADARTDLWAFGCILYECLAGRPAFPGGTASDVMAATLVVEPDWSALPPETPDRVRDLLRRCLAKDPGSRLGRIGDARRELELAPGGRPTIVSGLHPPAVPNNLPAQVTSFVGRKREMSELRSLLDETRLLTLTGSGGCGKTRLALELAGELSGNYPDGIWFAELAPLTDPALAPRSVASALGVKERPDEPLADTLAGHLREKASLLILDNCEHVLTACAGLAETLLHACSGLSILATSREGLSITGETTYRVPSLAVPDGRPLRTAADAASFESVQLFVERARAAKPSFALTDEGAVAAGRICRRLDGIPLAIELAAARVRALSLEQISQRLDESFRLLTGGSRTALPRHRTLEATIEWSHDLLSEQEKTLLRRLAVFTGGWTLDAAERVCADDAGIPDVEVLDLLTSLVDRSLVNFEETAEGEGRYRLLESVRRFAGTRLDGSGEGDAVRDRHLDYFLGLAEDAELKLSGPEQPAWLTRLEAEHENILRALRWCDTAGAGAEKALRLTGSLWRFWEMHGHLATGAAQIAKALEREGPAPARAKALGGAGFMANTRGEYERACALLEQALALRRDLGDKTLIAGTLSNLGVVVNNTGDYARARALHEESLALRRELDDTVGITTSLICLGNVARAEGDLSSARGLYEEGLSVQERAPDTYLGAHLINNLGSVAHAEGAVDEARGHLERALTMRRDLGDKRGVASSLEAVAGLAAAMGEPRRAARLFGAAERLRRVIGSMIQGADRGRYERDIAVARRVLDDRDFQAAWTEGGTLGYEDAVDDALGWLAQTGRLEAETRSIS